MNQSNRKSCGEGHASPCLLVLVSMVAVFFTIGIIACGDGLDEEEAQADTSPCGSMCNMLFDCSQDEGTGDYWSGFKNVKDCVNDCNDVEKDQALQCMFECDTDLSCNEYTACILDC